MSSKLASILPFIAVAYAQQIGTLTTETHPPLTWEKCTAPGSCTTVAGSVTMDSNWRWLHSTSGSTNCYTGNTWNAALCPNDTACAANCALDGADYSGTYGVTATGNALKIDFVTKSAQTNVGARLFLMADETHYQTFDLRNQEFTFDVDVSKLPCGLNGALYMSGMAADGGVSQYPGNKAGAKYGVGYCDSQCPRDLKFINGVANVDGWVPDSNSANSGIGNHGSCCAEMDIWEANSISAALTPHSCDTVSQTMCTGDACGGATGPRYGGTCDPDGCDFNSYRMGDTTFYGPGMTVNTNSVFTVVTQYLTADGTSTGTISEIKRFYVQNGVVIPNSQSTISGVSGNSITESFCKAQKAAFNNTNSFDNHGGLASMSSAMEAGMVLVLSLWDDYAVNMLWLDSDYPDARGTCPTTSGVPATIESTDASAYVIYSNIKVGAINSTFSGTTSSVGGSQPSSSASTPPSSVTSTPPTVSQPVTTTGAAHYAQCGGINWAGATTCAGGYTCTVLNPYFSQCL
ncbi:hypothetical protein G7Y89_g9321 [Cudoniella acicularis]|uniref:Glucanase n=1 Tax=Cudoniella acicularis TaxID=354080 RepID=A0A8H4RFT6_9HELO|nr:hypothetical protein G7Y89_g9321 [Cudoniella acicularis]